MGMSDEQKLALLRVQMHTAYQVLEGDALNDFWALVDEVRRMRPGNGCGCQHCRCTCHGCTPQAPSGAV